MPKPVLTLQPFGTLRCEVCMAMGVNQECAYSRALTLDCERLGLQPASLPYEHTRGGPDLVCEAHVDAPFPANDKAGRALA